MVANSLLSKKPKSLFFNQFALKQVASLLNLQPTSNSDEDSTGRVRDIARGMLVTLCTDMELGVCYKAKDVPGGLEKYEISDGGRMDGGRKGGRITTLLVVTD